MPVVGEVNVLHACGSRACPRWHRRGFPDRPRCPHREQARSHSEGDLQVQRMPQCAQGGFLHGFTQCRVGVNGAGNVFQAGAHFH